MPATNYGIHVVSKRNLAEHAVFKVDFPSVPLGPSSVRVRSHMLGISSNNLLYARTSHIFPWYDAYPVPSFAPAPYANASEWGIIPSWGFARVLESTVPAIASGSFLFGFWPTSAYPVDLKLAAAEPQGHWIEVSEHRQRLFNLNNRIVQVPHAVDESVSETNRDAWAATFKPVWECAYLMSRYMFATPGSGVEPVHPFGEGPWTAEDADLRRAVVVSLSASSKTGRSFTWQLTEDREVTTSGPLALLQATSAPSVVAELGRESALQVKSVHYDALAQPDTISWINSFKPARVVVIDFGAPSNALKAFASAIKSASEKTALSIIGVGQEGGKIGSLSRPQAAAEEGSQLPIIPLNTSGIRDHAMKVTGFSTYFQAMNTGWDKYLQNRGGDTSKLTWRIGAEDGQGAIGLWVDLLEYKLRPGENVVFKP